MTASPAHLGRGSFMPSCTRRDLPGPGSFPSFTGSERATLGPSSVPQDPGHGSESHGSRPPRPGSEKKNRSRPGGQERPFLPSGQIFALRSNFPPAVKISEPGQNFASRSKFVLQHLFHHHIGVLLLQGGRIHRGLLGGTGPQSDLLLICITIRFLLPHQ